MAKQSILAKWSIALIKAYRQQISPRTPSCCRYVPTCSQYGIDAINHYGFWWGSLKTMWRIIRCNPWSKGGYDPAVSDCQCPHRHEENT